VHTAGGGRGRIVSAGVGLCFLQPIAKTNQAVHAK
jgi:hypothetical protein